jgi:hypothetical protein
MLEIPCWMLGVQVSLFFLSLIGIPQPLSLYPASPKLCELRVFSLRALRLGFNAFTAEYAEIKTQGAQSEED